jgi:uncharacterized membrane-anchored protein
MDHVQRDAALLLEGKGLPDVGVNLEGKQVVIVAPGHGLREQLKSIRPFVRERKPVIIAVGDAADDARDVLRAPVIIVGGVEVCSEDVLKRASHVVVHDASGTDAGLTRVEALDVPHSVFESGIASEEVAILLAHARGASVIVTAGIDTRLLDFLEQGRAEVAGTFLTRLQAGASVVDATVLAAVYRHRFSGWLLVVMMLAGIAAVGAALYATPGGRSWLEDVWTTVGGWVGLA